MPCSWHPKGRCFAAKHCCFVLLLRPSAVGRGVLRVSRVGLFMDVVLVAVAFFPNVCCDWDGRAFAPGWHPGQWHAAVASFCSQYLCGVVLHLYLLGPYDALHRSVLTDDERCAERAEILAAVHRLLAPYAELLH